MLLNYYQLLFHVFFHWNRKNIKEYCSQINHREILGEFYCQQCGKWLCQVCNEEHKRLFKDHFSYKNKNISEHW